MQSVQGQVTLADAIAKLTAKGTLVEVYANDDDVITNIVVVETFVAKLNSWRKADTNNDVKEAVTLKTTAGAWVIDNQTNSTFETTKFTKEDAEDGIVVLYTKSGSSIKSVVAAEKVTGEVSKVTGTGSFVVDGTTYNYSANKIATVSSSVVGDDKEYDFYMDKYGYMIYTEQQWSQPCNPSGLP